MKLKLLKSMFGTLINTVLGGMMAVERMESVAVVMIEATGSNHAMEAMVRSRGQLHHRGILKIDLT